MTDDEAAAELRKAAADLEAVEARLDAIHARLPVSPGEDMMLLGSGDGRRASPAAGRHGFSGDAAADLSRPPAPNQAVTVCLIYPLRMFKHIGLALKVLRELKGVSQAGLARKAGIGKSQLSKYESGKDLPKFDSLEKVLAALGAQPLALFYLDHFLARIENQDTCDVLLLDTDFGPAVSESEQQAFARLFEDILLIFKAQVERRIKGGAGQ